VTVDSLGFQYAPLDGACAGLQLGEVGRAGVAAQVARHVDHGLDPRGAAVFGALPDAGLLVEHVDDDTAGVRTDGRAVVGLEGASSVALHWGRR